MKNNTLKAVLLIVSGPALLFVTLFAYAISNFVFGAIEVSGPNSFATLGVAINVILSLVGILGLLLILVGIPIGAILLVKSLKEEK